MENTNEKYEREAIKEKVKIDKDNLDVDTITAICTMIQKRVYYG